MMHFLPKSEAKKIMAGWMAEANGTAKNAAELNEPPEELAKLGPWKCTATTAKAVHVTKTQAAQLAPSTLADSDVLRLKNWKTIIRQISNGLFKGAGKADHGIDDIAKPGDFGNCQAESRKTSKRRRQAANGT